MSFQLGSSGTWSLHFWPPQDEGSDPAWPMGHWSPDGDALYREVTFPCEPESCGELCPLSCLFSPHSEFPCALILVALWGLNLKCTDCCCCRLVLPVLASCPRRQLSFTQLGLSQCLLSFWHKMPRCCLGFLPVCLKSTIFPRNWFSL